MLIYVLRRLLLMIPTLLGVMAANFLIVQAAPGGPVERTIALIKGEGTEATARLTGGSDLSGGPQAAPRSDNNAEARGSRGLPPELIAEIKRMYGFDKPPLERFLSMMRDYLTFDFGKSFFRDQRVVDLVLQKMPVSISIGLWTMLLTYAVSIPLGIAKAVRDGTRFDVWSSAAVAVGYAIPGFLFAVLLIVVFAGGSYFSWFPLRGLTSEGWADMSWPQRIGDYLWHLVLPITAMAAGGFAGLAMLTKNSFVEEINKQYVLTARAKGCGEKRILYGHIFRNAMLLVVAGFPAAFIGALFTGGLLIEVIFSLDGLGLLGFEAAINRDYPVMFGTLYFFTILGLVMNLVGDLMYVAIDPRIDFAERDA